MTIPHPNPNPNRQIRSNLNKRIKERGRKGRGWPTSPLRGTEVTPARGEKKGRPGAQLAGIRPQGRRGQAARRRRAHPLGSAHADEGADDGVGTSLLALAVVARLVTD